MNALRLGLACLGLAFALPVAAQPRGLEPLLARVLNRQGVATNVHTESVQAQSLLQSAPATLPPAPLRSEVVDGLMVQFTSPEAQALAARGEPPPADLAAVVLAASSQRLHYQRTMALGYFVFRFEAPVPIADALAVHARLGALGAVRNVELDVRARTRLVPDDTYYAMQHALAPPSILRGGIDAAAAWETTTGSPDTVVAILDSGVLPHAEFAGRLLPGHDFVSAVFNANDGDGRDGNAADPGNWVTAAEARAHGCDEGRSNWHGTHVAGIVAARGNNGYGVAGVNWHTRILPVRVIGKCGGATSDVIDGLLWAAGLPVQGAPPNPTPAHVINMSLGVYSPLGCTAAFQAAIGQVKSRGVLLVVAAGNENDEAARYVPAACQGVITVGSVDMEGFQASYTNYSTQYKVAVSAPGGDGFWGIDGLIASTTNAGTTTPAADAFVQMQGTSMAAPHVSGIASLALAANPQLSSFEVAALLLLTSHEFNPQSVCTTWWPMCGAGIANAANMVGAANALRPYRTVAEFHNPDTNHYFRTGDRDEPAIVESGVMGTWRNTEDYFIAWRDGSQGAVPVCRFYSAKFNSHFYTAESGECEAVKRNGDWRFEGVAFYAKLPLGGACPADTTPIHRFYNNRHGQNDGNHRLTPYKDYYFASLTAQGWSYEGVKMCAVA